MTVAIETTDQLELAGQVQTALAGLMEIESFAWGEQGALMLRGRLTGPSQALYRTIRMRMESLGFTPLLRRNADRDELVALPGVTEHPPGRVLLPVALFVITFLSVLMTGALYESGGQINAPGQILAGLPFAATLLGILGTHELGHYVAGRLRRAPVSLPYFIPLPPIPIFGVVLTFTGTLGAVIVQREPLEDRRTILEVGIAGPLAGLVVAVPLLFYGLATSELAPIPSGLYQQEGNSILYVLAKLLVFGRWLPSGGLDVHLNSVAWGAWIGLLITMFNLLPIGQLDGGHIAYALLGRSARYLAYGMIGLILILGVTVSPAWLVWGVLTFAIGPSHPAPMNDIAGLDLPHVALALFGLFVFVLLFTPALLTVGGG
ncbi:MAG: site-2 protease family protein [Roseiflexaceae bacterium]